MFTDLAHTALRTQDLERCLAFYTQLGLVESFRLNNANGSLMLVYLHIGGDRFLEIFPGGSSDPTSSAISSAPEGNFMHLCLRSSDLHADVQRLEAAGIAIDSGPSVGLDGNLQAWIRDPDGNALELMQLSEDSPQRRVARGEAAFSG